MDYSKLLQHCRDQHGIEVDTSKFTEELLWAIFKYFGDYHEKTLLHTEQWEVLEQLQRVSQTKIDQSLIQRLRTEAMKNIQEGQDKSAAHWGDQEGVLLSNGAVIEICDALENIAETVPDYGTGFRPDWRNIDPEYDAIAIDKSGKIYLFTHKPRKDAGQWWINSGMGSGARRYPFTIKGPVENWQECIWQRPGSREKEGTE